jgi:hypothetical protein
LPKDKAQPVRSKSVEFFARCWLSISFVVVTAILFKPAWWDGLLFGFRDTLHFYYPLWSHVDRLPWTEQILPLWNPLDGFGCSIVGEPTSMVFYPFRFILLLPIGSIEQRIGAFLLFHLWIAYSLWVYTGAKLGLPTWALQITAWAYALCGPVFFQIYNPPFLVGAAWLPLAMFGILKSLSLHWTASEVSLPMKTEPMALATGVDIAKACPTAPEARAYGSEKTTFSSLQSPMDRSTRERVGSIACLISALTMIVLGGDAQLAYHLAIISVIVVCCSVLQLRWSSQRSTADCFKLLLSSTSSLLIAFVMAVGLSAVQSIPTRYWLELSERTGPIDVNSETNVRNLSGAPYLFSEAPWNYSTIFVSNVLGNITPSSSRWLVPLGAEPSIWTPSLHVGTLVIAAAIAWWFTRLRTSLSVVTLVVTFVAILSSIGRYNLYEVWNAILPGYSQFRYPAKWTPFFAWGVCLVATEGIAHLHEPTISKLVQRFCCVVAVLGSAAASLNLLVYFSPTVRDSVYELLIRSAKIKGVETDLDMTQAVYFIGYGGFLAICSALAIHIALRLKSLSAMRIGVGLITVVELIIALQPSLVFVRPLSVDPLPGLPPETTTSWGHFTTAEKAQQAKKKLGERSIDTVWEFGGMKLPVLRAKDVPFARQIDTPWDSWEMQAVSQGNKIMGKLHLLRNFRSFQAYYTLGPKAIRRFCSSPPVDLEVDPPEMPSGVKANGVEEYYVHHLSPITNPPTWPPSTPPDSLKASINFTKAIMISNRLEFDYESQRAFYLQLPILDDGGWSITRPINQLGSDVSIVKGPEDLLTLTLPAGKHSIALRFFPPGLLLGGIILCGTVGLIAAATLLANRRRFATSTTV